MSSIKQQIRSGKKAIAVYGLGNVGGPIAAAWLRKGARVIGVDVSAKMLGQISAGQSHKKEPHISETFAKAIRQGKLTLSSDGIAASKESQIKFVAVPVDIKKNKVNLNIIRSAVTTVSKGLKKNDAVIICPTVPPGTTQNMLKKILEKNSGLKAERDFMLVYSPERIYEGRALQDIEENYPTIVSGLGPKSLRFADELFKIIAKKGTIKMGTLANAEAEKLFEGVYRDVNIALANELAHYCEKAGVDYWDAIRGANSTKFINLHKPGTGVGGLCIPVYPRFITGISSQLGLSMRLIENSRRVNDAMPIKCANDAAGMLKEHGVRIRGSKVAVLGLGFRGEVTDTRLSPTYPLVRQLLKMGAKVAVHDPYITQDEMLDKRASLEDDLKAAIKGASLVIIAANHKMYYKISSKSLAGMKGPRLVFDGRNIIDGDSLGGATLMTVGKR